MKLIPSRKKLRRDADFGREIPSNEGPMIGALLKAELYSEIAFIKKSSAAK